MKKTVTTLALAGVIGFAGAVPAMAAAPMYPGDPSICATVSRATVAVGDTFTFASAPDNNDAVPGTCFVPGEAITISITLNTVPQAIGGGAGGAAVAVPAGVIAPLAPTTSTTADANGEFSVPVTLNEVGTYTLTASGTSGSYSTTVTVVSAAGSSLSGQTPSSGLAATGAESNLLLWSLVGAGALAAGATSVMVVRRRAKAESAV